MGEKQIRSWAGIATLASLNTTHNHELIVMSAARARLCETLAKISSFQVSEIDAFYSGMLSMIDVILGMPMEKAIEPLCLKDDTVQVLKGHRATPIGRIFALVEACERGAWSSAHEHRDQLGISHPALVGAYYEALNWSLELLSTTD